MCLGIPGKVIEISGEGVAAEGFPSGFELGDLLAEALSLLENSGGVVEIAEGVAFESGGDRAVRGFLKKARFREGVAAAGANAETGAGTNGEFSGISECAGFARC